MRNIIFDAKTIINQAFAHVQPDNAVKNALTDFPIVKGQIVCVAIGKAAWTMAHAAYEALGVHKRIETYSVDQNENDCFTADGIPFSGIVITKYNHSKGLIPGFSIYEAGHPVPDDNTFLATQKVIDTVSYLSEDDVVLFLVSGGGSALFEKPLIADDELKELTDSLLASGADIVEMNTVRKRVSAVKGGRFAEMCKPASVFSVVLSDIIGDPLDMIASGPAYPDSTTCEQAVDVVKKYGIRVSDKLMACLLKETPKILDNIETHITGSVTELCKSAKESSLKLGYKPIVLTSSLSCEAKEAGAFFAAIAREYSNNKHEKLAFIAGGETVVHLSGCGLGGRNQELALSAAQGISGLNNTLLFSVGSDGTDGPTDAAGGYVTGETAQFLLKSGIIIDEVIKNNDSYHALKVCGENLFSDSENLYEGFLNGGLVISGPTGTNVNDLTVLLLD